MRGFKYESERRRESCVMCKGCQLGSHALCISERCPCVCNDSDFRWSRKPKGARVSATQQEMAHVLAVRPELAELFGMAH